MGRAFSSNTDNNSDEMIGDLLNDLYTKDDSGNDTPMKKKQLFEYETPLKPSNDLLIFKNTQTFLSPTTKEFQRSIEKAMSSVKFSFSLV